MKRIIFSLLLILTQGCGSNSELKGNRINVIFRDSLTIPHEYYLLAVRDTAIIVAPGYYDKPGPPFLIANSKISRVVHSTGDDKTLGAIYGGVIGLGVSVVAIVAIGLAKGSEKIQGGEGLALGGALLALPVIVIAAASGYAAVADEAEYNLDNPNDRNDLVRYSKYSHREPPELQKIK
jgi:hypothetical protein